MKLPQTKTKPKPTKEAKAPNTADRSDHGYVLSQADAMRPEFRESLSHAGRGGDGSPRAEHLPAPKTDVWV